MSARRRHIFPDDYIPRDAVLFPDDDAAQSFSYSDGDEAENYLLDVLSKAKDRSLFSEELRHAIRDWPSRYHLSRKRANLLRPFAPFLRGRVLETGAGCGAITRFLGENGGEVVAVERSPWRARIARMRTEDLLNVTVVCDRVEHLRVVEKFDAITVIGVLEYAGVYEDEDPYRTFLRNVASKLNDSGVVILAIENKLGLKYLAGAREDHTGGEFDGVNDGYRAKSPATFGAAELAGLLRDSGLTAQGWYVPSPDYKLPDTIISGALITAHPNLAASLASQTALSDPQRPSDPTFSLEQAWKVVGKNYLLGELANSFLVVCGKNAKALAPFESAAELAWHYNVERHAAFTKATEFVKSGETIRVERHALAEAEAPSVPIIQSLSGEPFREGKNWWDELSRVVNRPNWTVGEVADWAKVWLEALAKECGFQTFSAEIFSRYVDGKYFSAVPFNFVVDSKGNNYFFNQEWALTLDIEFGYIVFRGLRESIYRIFSFAPPSVETPLHINHLSVAILEYIGVFLARAQIDRFSEIENRVQQWVQGQSVFNVLPEAIAASWNVPLPIRSAVERNTLAQNNQSLRIETGVLRYEIGLVERKARASEAEVQRLSTEVEGLWSSKAIAEADRDQLFGERQNVEAHIAKLRSENDRLQIVGIEFSKLQVSHALVRQNLANLSGEKATILSQLSVNSELLRESQGLTQKLSGELDLAREELDKHLNEKADRTAQLESLQDEAAQLKGKISQLKFLLSEKDREMKTTADRAREIQAELVETQRVLKQGSKLSQELSALLADERLSTVNALSKLAERDSLVDQRTEERDAASRKLAQALSELSKFRETSTKLYSENRRAEQLAAALERDHRELQVVRGYADRLSKNLTEQTRILEAYESKNFARTGFLQRLFSSRRLVPTASERWQVDAIRSSKLFSAVKYLQRYPDVASTRIDPVLHYIRYGEKEARDIHYLFDAAYYRRNYIAVSRAQITSLAHYQSIGVVFGNDPHPLFDTDFYLQQVEGKIASSTNPLFHFCEEGWRSGINPHPLFDTNYYLSRNSDVRSAGENPLIHYCVFGWREGRNPSPAFDVGFYLKKHPDVAIANTEPLAHYSEYGKAEGRAILYAR